jgi:hypothetical protein
MNQYEADALGVELYSEPYKLDLNTITYFKNLGYKVVLVAWSKGVSTSLHALLKDCVALENLSGFINIRGRIDDKLPRWGLTCENKNLVGIYNFNRKDSYGYLPGTEYEFYYTLRNRFGSTLSYVVEDRIPHFEQANYEKIIEIMEEEINGQVQNPTCP